MEKVVRRLTADWLQAGLQEYMLVVQPPGYVTDKILIEKSSLYNDFQQPQSTLRQPRIVVAHFSAREEMEETIVRYLQRILLQQPCFQLTLNNYSGDMHQSIFLRIQSTAALIQLADQLAPVSTYINSCSCPPIKLNVKPHLAIAEKLPEVHYLKAMMAFSQKTFYETFMVTGLMLIRRSNEYDIEKPVTVFRLQPSESMLYN
jgi:hypothetical protein